MSLKNLSQFQMFDVNSFMRGKALGFMSAEPWVTRTDSGQKDAKGNVIYNSTDEGVKVNVVIKTDETDYREPKKGELVRNTGKTFAVKVPHKSLDDFKDFQMFVTDVYIRNVQKASIYGDYKNELSITADVLNKEQAQELKRQQAQAR